MKWRKSTYSEPNGACVQLAQNGSGVAIRDSKDPNGPVLHFTKPELAAFLDGIKSGEFDDLVL